LLWGERGPGTGDCYYEGRDQHREKADADYIFHSHSLPLHTTFIRRFDSLSPWTEVGQTISGLDFKAWDFKYRFLSKTG
jgi:hypothetical protein